MTAKEQLIVRNAQNANYAYSMFLENGLLDENMAELIVTPKSKAAESGLNSLFIIAFRMHSFIEYAWLLEKQLKKVDPDFMSEVSAIYNYRKEQERIQQPINNQ